MLDVEALIRQRLAATVPDLVGVHSAAALGIDDVGGKKLPAAFVVNDGYRVLEVTSHGAAVRIAARWLVIVVVRAFAQAASGERSRADAGPLVMECLRALMGWQPRVGVQALQPVTPPAPVYQDGILLYPLAFEAAMAVQRRGDA